MPFYHKKIKKHGKLWKLLYFPLLQSCSTSQGIKSFLLWMKYFFNSEVEKAIKVIKVQGSLGNSSISLLFLTQLCLPSCFHPISYSTKDLQICHRIEIDLIVQKFPLALFFSTIHFAIDWNNNFYRSSKLISSSSLSSLDEKLFNNNLCKCCCAGDKKNFQISLVIPVELDFSLLSINFVALPASPDFPLKFSGCFTGNEFNVAQFSFELLSRQKRSLDVRCIPEKIDTMWYVWQDKST